jgi:TetR/AcrR family transcriptional regulator, transcriptional repressor for nem operon
MGHSREEKAQSHDRIVRIAANRFREFGLQGLSIANVMKEAGLTHGGFYKHFQSRDDLVMQALAAIREERKKVQPVKAEDTQEGSGAALGTFVEEYLSAAHRDSPSTACPLGTLMSDLARAGDGARNLGTAWIREDFENLASLIQDADAKGKHAKAIVALSTMAGALGLARVVSDGELADEILREAREYLIAHFAEDAPAQSRQHRSNAAISDGPHAKGAGSPARSNRRRRGAALDPA